MTCLSCIVLYSGLHFLTCAWVYIICIGYNSMCQFNSHRSQEISELACIPILCNTQVWRLYSVAPCVWVIPILGSWMLVMRWTLLAQNTAIYCTNIWMIGWWAHILTPNTISWQWWLKLGHHRIPSAKTKQKWINSDPTCGREPRSWDQTQTQLELQLTSYKWALCPIYETPSRSWVWDSYNYAWSRNGFKTWQNLWDWHHQYSSQWLRWWMEGSECECALGHSI